MQEVEITRAVRLNVTGFDREPIELEPGRHTLPARAADWIRRNPSFGRVIETEPERQAADGDGEAGNIPEAAPDADAETPDSDGDGEAGTEGKTRRRTTRRKE